jgi:hypothetical protein
MDAAFDQVGLPDQLKLFDNKNLRSDVYPDGLDPLGRFRHRAGPMRNVHQNAIGLDTSRCGTYTWSRFATLPGHPHSSPLRPSAKEN